MNASDLEDTLREIEIMSHLDHPGVVHLHEVYEDTKYIYLIMDLAAQGTVSSREPYLF